jgi:hypothetical protein
MAVVDSGADSSALPISYASALGIDIDQDCTEAKGMSAGGESAQWIYTPGLRAEVFGREFKMVAMFTKTPLILLGQADFFMQFHVAFDGRAKELTLRAY